MAEHTHGKKDKTGSIEDIIASGFELWKKNISLGVPFVLSAIATATILIASIILLFVLIGFSGVMSAMGNPLLMQQELMGSLSSMAAIIILVSSFSLALIGIVNSFLIAGAVGMAKEAITKGTTSLGDMVNYGKRRFFTLFMAGLLILLFYAAGSIFIIPGIIEFLSNSLTFGLIFSLIGIIIWLVYAFVLGMLLLLVPQAVVVSNLGVLDSIKRSYSFFMDNKMAVVVMWIALKVMEEVTNTVLTTIGSLFAFIPLLGTLAMIFFVFLYGVIALLVITPVVTVWWTKLYINRS